MEAVFSATAVVGGFVDMASVPMRACHNYADVIWIFVFKFDGHDLRHYGEGPYRP
jgi:hypothetical protein